MYKSKSDLPKTLREYLPEELQDIYLKAYQRAWEEYEDTQGGDIGREAVAHRDAMMAVEHDYVYHEDMGKWYAKGEEPVAEEKRQENIVDRVKDFVEGL
jgi:cation transport regulator